MAGFTVVSTACGIFKHSNEAVIQFEKTGLLETGLYWRPASIPTLSREDPASNRDRPELEVLR
jgi:hypothetical protein